MTTGLVPRDLIEEVRRLRGQVAALQGRQSLPQGYTMLPTGQPWFPNGVAIGGGGNEHVNSLPDVPMPEGPFNAIPGSSFDTIYVDLDWQNPTGFGQDQVVAYDVVVTKAGSTVAMRYPVERSEAAASAIRIEPLEPNTTYTVDVASITKLGQRSTPLTTAFNSGADTSIPATPSGLAATAGIRSLSLSWNANAERDVANGAGQYHVQVSTNATFTQIVRDFLLAATATVVTELSPVEHWVRIKARDSSGNESEAWSASVTSTPRNVGASDASFAVGGGNLLANSSAENGTAGWTFSNASGSVSTSTIDASTAHHGAQSIKTVVSAIGAGYPRLHATITPTVFAAGDKVVCSIWVKGPVGGTFNFNVLEAGATRHSKAGFTATGSWQRVVFPITVTAAGGDIRPYINPATVGDWWLDAAQVEIGDVATAYAPKPGEILPGTITATEIANGSVTAPKVGFTLGGGNGVTNSSFEVDIDANGVADNWSNVTGSGATWVTSRVAASIHGSWAQRVEMTAYNGPTSTSSHRLEQAGGAPAGTPMIRVEPGKVYTFSAFLSSNTNLWTAWMQVTWRTGTTNISSTTIPAGQVLPAVATRYAMTLTAPAGADNVAIRVGASRPTTSDATLGWYQVDAVQFELGDLPTAYAPRPDELLAGTVTATEIADNAITTPKLIAGAITTAKIAAGAITANEVAAGTITGDRIAGNTITAKQMVVGSFDNLIANPGVEQSTTSIAPHVAQSSAVVAVSATGGRSGAQALLVDAKSDNAASDVLYLNGALASFNEHVQCSVGEQFYCEAWARREVAGTAPNAYRLILKFRNRAGSVVQSVDGGSITPSGTSYERLTVTGTAPAGAVYVVATLFQLAGTATGRVLVDDVFMRRLNEGNLIVDGAITANKIAAGSIVTDKLAAGAITAEKIAAGTITAGEIAAGAIVADKLAANAVTTDKLAANTVTAEKLAAVAIAVGKHIESAGYVAGSTGWHIDGNGSAEFNTVTVRGDLIGSDFAIERTNGIKIRHATYVGLPSSTPRAIRFVDADMTTVRASIVGRWESTEGSQIELKADSIKSSGHQRVMNGITVYGNTAPKLMITDTGTTVEIGRYLDFHADGIADNATDYDARLEAPLSDSFFYLHGRKLYVGAGISVGQPVGLRLNRLHLHNDGDDNHSLVYNSGINGPELGGWDSVQLRSHAADANLRLQNDGNAVLYDNGAAWGMKSIGSSRTTKQAVETYEVDALAMVRAFRPVTFLRSYNDPRPMRQAELDELLSRGRADDETPEEYAALVRVGRARVKAAQDTWATRLDPKVQRRELGLIAEEVEAVEPLLVTPPSGDMPKGLMYPQIAVVLLRAVQQLDAELKAVAARVPVTPPAPAR